jgi:hypothetical protein
VNHYPSNPPRDPTTRLGRAPRQILPATGPAPIGGWGPKPTGYQPDMNGETIGRFARQPGPTVDPQSLVFPTEPVDAGERVDQHGYLQVSATWTPPAIEGFARPSGGHDPLSDGPVAPVPRMLALFNYRGSGTTRTRFMDVPDGRRFSPTGTQDGTSTVWFENAAVQQAPYVDRDSYATIDTTLANPAVQNPDSFSKLAPGPDHGWTSVPVVNLKANENNKARVLRQQQFVTQNRRAGSTYAGQTYGQSTAHVANPAGQASVPSWRTRG